jgi:hypothetical protein
MEQQIKEDWIINNRNVLGLSKEIWIPFFSIQGEILYQLEGKKNNSMSHYLKTEIDITKKIRFTTSVTIQSAFENFLGFENFNPLKIKKIKCSMILSYLQLSLLNEYQSKNHKNILFFSEYENQYSILLNAYLSSNIDTNEQDFIKAELNICDNLMSELIKPIYNEIDILDEIVLDLPCSFKKNLINSLNKRKKFLEEKEKETVPKVKALFKFIAFLHSNIDNFKQYDEVLNELHLLDKQRNQLSLQKNFKDKMKYDEIQIQAEIKDKFKIIQENILQPIQTKATELNICDLNKTYTLWNWNISDISTLKENFSQKDLSEIFRHKRKYIEYREKTKGEAFFELGFFFNDLDEVLKVLFDFFKETEQNEFEAFETKAMQVNDIGEIVKLKQLGHKKFNLPNSFLNTSTIQQKNNIEPLQSQSRQPDTSTTIQNYIPKPFFKPESVEEIVKTLKSFFDVSQQDELRRIIESGNDANEMLLFKDNGNKLTDYLKRLIENNTIISCRKKDLIKWIVKNFKYVNGKTEKNFNPKTVEKTISGTGQPCKNPII